MIHNLLPGSNRRPDIRRTNRRSGLRRLLNRMRRRNDRAIRLLNQIRDSVPHPNADLWRVGGRTVPQVGEARNRSGLRGPVELRDSSWKKPAKFVDEPR